MSNIFPKSSHARNKATNTGSGPESWSCVLTDCRDYLLPKPANFCTNQGWDVNVDGACYNTSVTPKLIKALWNTTRAGENDIKRILPTEEYLR